MEEYKRCAMCGEKKPISLFYKNTRTKDGLHSYCISCTRSLLDNGTNLFNIKKTKIDF